MKKIKLLVLFVSCFIAMNSFSQSLALFKSNNINEANQIAQQNNLKIHFQNNKIVISSGTTVNCQSFIILDETAWQDNENYFYIELPKNDESYFKKIELECSILYKEDSFLIAKATNENVKNLFPAVHGGLINIPSTELVINPIRNNVFKDIVLNPDIANMIDSIKIDSISENVIHMQNYGTRNAYTSTSVDAQNWIQEKFENMGLDVYIQDFPMPNGGASDNVVAVQTGTVYPDSYVVIGGHYDSYSFEGLAPGADDNATGVATVMEIARVLKNYQFNFSIMYCAFSGEEYGLYGSQALATAFYTEGLEIIGYLNLDMVGYLEPGNDYFTGLCAYQESFALANFFIDIVDTYVDNFYVAPGFYQLSSSDHSSFRQYGYQAIWPWEDVNNISPYIHSPLDTFYLSVNSTEYMQKFAEASLGFMAELAEPFNGYYPPMYLAYEETENTIELIWQKPIDYTDFLQFNVYKNGNLISSISNVEDTTFTDPNVELTQQYSYYVTTEYNGTIPGESLPSNSIHVTFGLKELYSYDFEDGTQNWTIGNDQYSWQWGESISISGNYSKYISIDSYEGGMNSNITGYAVSPILNLKNSSYLTLNYDYAYKQLNIDELEILCKPTPSMSWIKIDSLEPILTFQSMELELPVAAQTDSCQIAFYYNDHGSWARYAGFDNVRITGYNNDASFAAPENLNLQLVGSNISLSWDIPVAKNLIKYCIYRNNVLFDSVENTATTEYIDENINLEAYYYYFITGVYEGGQSCPSNFVTFGEPEEISILDKSNLKIEIYPNPANDIINIDIPEDINAEIIIIDSNGKQVIKEFLNKNNHSIDIHKLSSGTYILQLKTTDRIYYEKLTVI